MLTALKVTRVTGNAMHFAHRCLAFAKGVYRAPNGTNLHGLETILLNNCLILLNRRMFIACRNS